jgi:hypothetical protein
MPRLPSQPFAWTLAACLIVACHVTPAIGQGLGPDVFGIVPSFGMSSPITARQLAMGAPIACVNDVVSANPAFTVLRDRPDAGLRVATTSFNRGPRLNSLLAYYAQPLRPNETALELTVLSLNSGSGDTMLPYVGPTAVDMSEREVVVDYGRRLNPRLTAGLSVLGYSRIDLAFTLPAGPALLDLAATADFGGRVGAAYELAPNSFAGVVYSFSQQTVDMGAVQAASARKLVYHSDQFAIGVSGQIDEKLFGVVEYQHGSTSHGGQNSATSSLRIGAERAIAPGLAVRAGVADRAPTVGFGYRSGRWQIDYAYLRDWNDAAVGRLFGHSRTHSLQAICRW